MEVSRAMSICIKNGIKIYPVSDKLYFYVEYRKNDDKPITSKIRHLKPKEINEALVETYIYYAEKLEINK